MALPVFYYPPVYQEASNLLLEGDIVKHIVQVLRMKSGEQLQLTDGKGTSALATILHTSKKSCEVRLSDIQKLPQPPTRFCLAIAFTKNASRNEWLLEKATELGASVIQPLMTHRTERVHSKEERWQNILVSAMLQSQQYYLPVLEKPKELKTVVIELKMYEQKFIAHCEKERPRAALSRLLQPQKNTCVLIGPEGDFTPEEIETAMDNGFEGIDLGNNRLRTETAAITVCAYFKLMNP